MSIPTVHEPSASFPPRLHSHLGVLLLVICGCTLAVAPVHAAAPDFSGAWRLDDQHSDNAATLTTLLRTEARREQPAAQLPANHAGMPSGATGSGTGTGRYGSGAGGHRMGGMGGGGTGGGGMGGGMAHGGMGGGGHDRHHGGDSASQKPYSPQDAQAQTQFALPPLLQRDSVLLVQEHAQSVAIQLDNGERLNVRLDGHARQSLDGDAMVEGEVAPNAVRITIHYAEGGELQQDWVRSADGRHLTLDCTWKPPSMQKPVHFQRSYLAVG